MIPTIICDFFGFPISIKKLISVQYFYRYLGHYNIYAIEDYQRKEVKRRHLQMSQLEQIQNNSY